MHPMFFVVYGLAVLVLFVALYLRACALVRSEDERDLSAPAGALPTRAEDPVLPCTAPPASGLRRGGQHDLAFVQERAARAVLHPRSGVVSVAPARCPFDQDARD